MAERGLGLVNGNYLRGQTAPAVTMWPDRTRQLQSQPCLGFWQRKSQSSFALLSLIGLVSLQICKAAALHDPACS
jgi:hypothetical protein